MSWCIQFSFIDRHNLAMGDILMRRVLIMVTVAVLGMTVCMSLVGCESDDYAYVGGPGREGFTAPALGPHIVPAAPAAGDAVELLPWEIAAEEAAFDPYYYNGYNSYWYWW